MRYDDGAMDRATKARIDSLVFQLRQRSRDVPVPVDDLARRYQLDPLMVRRLAQAEGLPVPELDGARDEADDRSPTGVFDLDELRKLEPGTEGK